MNTEWDVIISGNGSAALTLAFSLPESCRIAVLCKNRLQHSASNHAQGGIAAVLYDPDMLEKHVADTLTAGAGLCDETAVRDILAQGGQAIEWLLQFGAAVRPKFRRPPAFNPRRRPQHASHRTYCRPHRQSGDRKPASRLAQASQYPCV
ncbi:FAD-binding protein [Neisseria wadsworthii]|uniref:FAD-binding protein n=1 Tax=Neisseria wadsworthii TaxID=607711 RepID=UPI00131B19FB